MATFTDVINQVLRKMRESAVAGPSSSTYAALIGELVNDTRREVEDAWRWSALGTLIPVTTIQGQQSPYSLTGSGDRFSLRHPLERAVLNQTTGNYLRRADHVEQLAANVVGVPLTESEPTNYRFYGRDANGDRLINILPVPDAVYTIWFSVTLPQEDMTEGSEVITVPSYPVMLGAYAKALEERGEDQGKLSDRAYLAYQAALGDSIARDVTFQPEDTIWFAK